MSLLNQVLRNLDGRRAGAQGDAGVVRTVPLSRPPLRMNRVAAWSLGGVLTALAVVSGGVAQGSIAWPSKTAARAPVAPMPMLAVAPAAEAPIASAPTASAAPAPAQTTEPKLELAPSMQVVVAKAELKARPSAPVHTAKAKTVPNASVTSIDKHAPLLSAEQRARNQYQHGIEAQQQGRYDEAARAYAAALHEDPSYHAARQAQAALLIGQSRRDEARALLQEGLTLTPQQPTLAMMLARLQAEGQDLAGATQTLQTALSQAQGNAEYLACYAAILQRANQHDEAAAQFSAALRLVPARSVWWMGLGISLAAQGQTQAAREAFMRAKSTGALAPESAVYVDQRLRQLM